ncbi:MAG: hypothetical protein R3E10_01785 [Gemmatimonadota bacterium]
MIPQTQDPVTNDGNQIPRTLAMAFAPLHKRALGTAVGLAVGLVIFLVTAVYLLRSPDPGFDLGLLNQYFYGYTVSWAGAFIGAAWGFLVGAVIGWFIAFVRNLVLAVSVFAARTRAELTATRDFLDHI